MASSEHHVVHWCTLGVLIGLSTSLPVQSIVKNTPSKVYKNEDMAISQSSPMMDGVSGATDDEKALEQLIAQNPKPSSVDKFTDMFLDQLLGGDYDGYLLGFSDGFSAGSAPYLAHLLQRFEAPQMPRQRFKQRRPNGKGGVPRWMYQQNGNILPILPAQNIDFTQLSNQDLEYLFQELLNIEKEEENSLGVGSNTIVPKPAQNVNPLVVNTKPESSEASVKSISPEEGDAIESEA